MVGLVLVLGVPAGPCAAEPEVSCARCGSSDHNLSRCRWPNWIAVVGLLIGGAVQAAPACYPSPGDPVRVGSTYSAPTKQTVRWVAWWCRASDGSLQGAWVAGVSEVQFRGAFNEAAASGFDPAVMKRLWDTNVTGFPAVDVVKPTVEAAWQSIKPQ